MSNEKNMHAGLAFLLIILLAAAFYEKLWLLPCGIALLLIMMTKPGLLTPLTKIWFSLSEKIGLVMSIIILIVIFYSIVWPVGFVRNLLGDDPMQLKRWKKDNGSVFKIRQGKVLAKDLEMPY